MPVSKLKNLAILILVLANLALILLVLPSRLEAQQETAALNDSLCRLYAQQEISLTPETIPDTVPLYVLELKEDSGGSLQAATALLGEHLIPEDDSSRYLDAYRSSLGTCAVSRSGEFSAQLTGQKEQRDVETATKKLLKEMEQEDMENGIEVGSRNG